MSGHEYITQRLRAQCGAATPPELRALLNEAATVIAGRDEAIDGMTSFRLLKGIVAHWDEFGHEHGLDERMDAARRFIRRATA